MRNKKFKKEDAIELNEKNVAQIFKNCLATSSTDSKDLMETSFSYDSKVPSIKLDYKKLKSYKEQLSYMLGQLYYTHHFDDQNLEFQRSTGSVNYKGLPWTKNVKILFEFYYLQTAVDYISMFYPNNLTKILDKNSIMPTISPNDPNFKEWSSEHIEQRTSKKAGGVEPYDN